MDMCADRVHLNNEIKLERERVLDFVLAYELVIVNNF